MRELQEETGVVAKFVTVAAVREMHGAFQGKSNLYFVCLLKPSEPVQTLKPQAGEIARACWMPTSQFLSLPYYKTDSVYGRPVHTMLANPLHACTSCLTQANLTKRPFVWRWVVPWA